MAGNLLGRLCSTLFRSTIDKTSSILAEILSMPPRIEPQSD
jgi:hypothetical protein